MLSSPPLFHDQIFRSCGKAVDYSDDTGPGRAPVRMNLWKQVLDRLEQTIDRTEYETWFAPTRFLAQKGDTIDVSVPSQRFVDEIRERYGAADPDHPRRDARRIDLNLHFVADTDGTPMTQHPARTAAVGRAPAVDLQPALPVRDVRRRQVERARLRGVEVDRRESERLVQPALHLRRRRPRQDPSDPGHRPADPRQQPPARRSSTCRPTPS